MVISPRNFILGQGVKKEFIVHSSKVSTSTENLVSIPLSLDYDGLSLAKDDKEIPSGEALGCCWQAFLQSQFVRLAKRVKPMVLAILQFLDIGLDINQSITYFNLANDVNGTYFIYNTELLSPWYFTAAMVVWFLPSAILWLIMTFTFVKSMKHQFQTCLKYTIFVTGVIFISVPLLPVGAALVFALFYLIFPQVLCGNACTICIDPTEKLSYEEINENDGVFHHEFISFAQQVEMIGEAVLQLLLNVVFISFNFEYLLEHNCLDWFPVPISVVSAFFSIVSVAMCYTIGCEGTIKSVNAIGGHFNTIITKEEKINE